MPSINNRGSVTMANLSRIRDWINMTKYSNLKASVAPMVLGLAMVSAPAFAQDQDAQEAGAAESVIVVTGSRISNPNLELSSPVGVVTSEEVPPAEVRNC